MYASSLPGNDLADALFANPCERTHFAGHLADDETVRSARHVEAIPPMTGHIDDATHQLDLSATECHYFAPGITEVLTSAEDDRAVAARNTAGPALAPTPCDALTSPRSGRPLYGSSQRRLRVTQVADGEATRGSTAAEWEPYQEELDDRAAMVGELKQGVVDGCSPWACRGEVEPMQDDFGLAS